VRRLYLLVFLSGISGLIYQVVWVRVFGNVFGNTIHSAALVIAIFMLGLGAGSYLIGIRADRRYARAPDSLLRLYGLVELTIGGLGLATSLLLPRLATAAASLSTYVADERGWFVLSAWSYAARTTVAVVLLTPITMLMGGTLTLLIRYCVRGVGDTPSAPRIAALYGVNTAGAAAGALLTDFTLVPALGLLATQLLAVGLNLFAGAGALALSRGQPPGQVRRQTRGQILFGSGRDQGLVGRTAVALTLTGFAAMGLEILWLRHFTLLLGGFRAVVSLLLTVVLVGMGAGALLGGLLDRWTSRPAAALMLVQAGLVVATLTGIAATSAAGIAASGTMSELWYNLRPMLIEVGIPALLMGCSFPLANAIVQRVEEAVGRRAGGLYLANTAGAVAGSLVTGFVLLPTAGLQATVAILAAVAAMAIVPLALTAPAPRPATALAVVVSVAGLATWMTLPQDHLLRRSLVPQLEGERLLAIREGVGEVIAVTEAAGRGRGLLTNGHAMSSTALLDQRYMRALAHIPLLALDRPSRVLVIGFGVGNTTHAAALHRTIARLDVAELSRDVLEHAGYFRDANRDVLDDDRVSVFVSDGRLHLEMQPAGTYDLIALEPPPIAHAGVASLYSREFYALARTRLKPGGYVSQWFPAYQVPPATSLAMARAFLDVFPRAVLLSGAQAELILAGTTADRIVIDPGRVEAALQQAPEVRSDLERLDLGTVTEIVGTFVGSENTLARATRESLPVTDDRPLQEHAVRSVLQTAVRGVPASLFDVAAVRDWCPTCLDGDRPAPIVAGLDTYLALLDHAYRSPSTRWPRGSRRQVLDSGYLGAVVPDTDAVRTIAGEGHYDRGSALLERGEFERAATEFRAALEVLPESAPVHNNLGVALASLGRVDEATTHFRRAVALEPHFEEARNNLARATSR
jgi:predicted membrane-bound spermidine synthase